MKFPFRHICVCLVLHLAGVSAPAQFTLDIQPVSSGAGQLRFTLEPDYYYRLESSGDLLTAFAQASGWMLGNGTVATWPLNYPTGPVSGGSSVVAASDTFSLYPFANGRTVVSWRDLADVRYNAIVTQDYTALPPTVEVPESETTPGTMLLVGRIAWHPAYDGLSASLLPPAQQTVLARLPTPAAALAAATSGGATGPGVFIDEEKQFFRIRRMAADADGDGLDWATETFQLGTNPDAANTPANLTATADAVGIHLAWQGRHSDRWRDDH